MILAVLALSCASLLILGARTPSTTNSGSMALMTIGAVVVCLVEGVTGLAGLGLLVIGQILLTRGSDARIWPLAVTATLLCISGAFFGEALTVAGAVVWMGLSAVLDAQQKIVPPIGAAVGVLSRIVGAQILVALPMSARPSWWPVLLVLGAIGVAWGGALGTQRSARWMSGAAMAATSLCLLCLGMDTAAGDRAGLWLLIAVSLAEVGATLAEAAGGRRALGVIAALTLGGLPILGWRAWSGAVSALAEVGLPGLALLGAACWTAIAWRSARQLRATQSGLTLTTPPRRLRLALGATLLLLVLVGLLPEDFVR